MLVAFIKNDSFNDAKYIKGDKINVSSAVFSILKERGTIKEVISTKKSLKEEKA